jgi:hypothetical protein
LEGVSRAHCGSFESVRCWRGLDVSRTARLVRGGNPSRRFPVILRGLKFDFVRTYEREE